MSLQLLRQQFLQIRNQTQGLKQSQICYAGQKDTQHIFHVLLGDQQICEYQLSPTFESLQQSNIPMKMPGGIKILQIASLKAQVIVLTTDGVLSLCEFGRSGEMIIIKKLPSEQKIAIFDVIEVQRQLVLEKLTLSKNPMNNEVTKYTRQKTIFQKAVRLIIGVNGQKNGIMQEWFIINGEFQQSDLVKNFAENIVQLKASPENVFVLLANKTLILQGTQQQSIQNVKKIYRPRQVYTPLSVANLNFQRFPKTTENAQVDEMVVDLRQTLIEPDFANQKMRGEPRILYDKNAIRQQHDLTYLCYIDQQYFKIAAITEATAEIKQIIKLAVDQSFGQINQIQVFNGTFVALVCQKALAVYIIPQQDETELELQPLQIFNVEALMVCETGSQQAFLCLNSGQIIIYQFQNVHQIIQRLQFQLSFDPALSMCQFVDDFKLRQNLHKLLTAQKAVLDFNQKNYDQAFRLFLKSKIDPLCAIYPFTSEGFQLVHPDIAKQSLSLEQVYQNLPDSFRFQILPITAQNIQQYMGAVDQLRAYIHAWRGETLDQIRIQVAKRLKIADGQVEFQAIYDDMTPVQRKQMSNLDEALLKSFLLSTTGDQGMIETLFQSNLFIEPEQAIQLLKNQYPQALIKYLKSKNKYRQALEVIAPDKIGNDQTARAVATFLLDVGLGQASQPISDGLRQLHKQYYQQIYRASPLIFLDAFNMQVEPDRHPLDVCLALEFLNEEAQSLPLSETKCLVIENALRSANFYAEDEEDLHYTLMILYIERVTAEAKAISTAIQSGTLQTYVDIMEFLNQTFNKQLLLKRLGLTERDLLSDEKMRTVNFGSMVFDIENEALCAPLDPKDNVQRQMSEQLGGKLGQLRRKLSDLVRRLQRVDYQRFIDALPPNQLTEDRAVLNLKRYNIETGLQQIAIQMLNPAFAESVCDRIYSDSLQAGAEHRQLDVYLQLLKCFLQPPGREPMLTAALALMTRKFDRLNVIDVLGLLPKKLVTIGDLSVYLRILVSTSQLNEVDAEIMNNVCQQELVYQKKVLSSLNKGESLLSTAAPRCPVCSDLMKKDIVVYENGRSVCLKCFQNKAAGCNNVQQMKPVKGHRQFFDGLIE